MSKLSSYITASFASLKEALAGVSLNALMSPAMTAAAIQYMMQRKNYIVNGAMQISQEYNGAAVNVTSVFPVDQFMPFFTSGVLTSQQIYQTTPSGSPTRLRVTVTTTGTSNSTSQHAVRQVIEGSRMADLCFGTSAAKPMVFQIGMKWPMAGTFGVSFFNTPADRYFAGEVVISSAEIGQEVIKTIAIPGDVTGTWVKTNAGAMYVDIVLSGGFPAVPNQWATRVINGGPIYTQNQTNGVGTAGLVYEIFDVGLYQGTIVPKFVVPDYPSELTLCQRYWEPWIGNNTSGYGLFSSPLNEFTNSWVFWTFKVQKRAQPTFALGPGVTWSPTAPDNMYYSTTHISASKNSYFYAGGVPSGIVGIANARM
jgi:hypothetical protein